MGLWGGREALTAIVIEIGTFRGHVLRVLSRKHSVLSRKHAWHMLDVLDVLVW